MFGKKIPANDVRAALESIKEHVRRTIFAYQEGAGSQDTPFTADLAVAAIWREIDLRSSAIGANRGTCWFRVEVQPDLVANVFELLSKKLEVSTIDCVGPRAEGANAVLYLTTTGRDPSDLRRLLDTPGVLGVRDWRMY